jgi:hypothetical protein
MEVCTRASLVVKPFSYVGHIQVLKGWKEFYLSVIGLGILILILTDSYFEVLF